MSVIIYRLEVRATQPLATDPDDPDYPTLEYATSSAHKRMIEKSMMICLRRHELECDVELMDFTVEEQD